MWIDRATVNNLRWYLRTNKITQKGIAEKVGAKPSYISAAFNSKLELHQKYLLKIMLILPISKVEAKKGIFKFKKGAIRDDK